jgi:hypothetical protein
VAAACIAKANANADPARTLIVLMNVSDLDFGLLGAAKGARTPTTANSARSTVAITDHGLPIRQST